MIELKVVLKMFWTKIKLNYAFFGEMPIVTP